MNMVFWILSSRIKTLSAINDLTVHFVEQSSKYYNRGHRVLWNRQAVNVGKPRDTLSVVIYNELPVVCPVDGQHSTFYRQGADPHIKWQN